MSKTLVTGQKVNLDNNNLYSTYDSKNVEEKVSGIFYIYDGTIKNNRIRITDNENKVGKPAACTGWINNPVW